MIRFTCLVGSAAVLLSGITLTVSAQEEREAPVIRENRRPTSAEREGWREMSPEQRQERVRQWRESRDEGESTPASKAEAKPEKVIDQLEFRSILTLEGKTQFSLHNPFEERTFWVSAGESRNGVEVVEFKDKENVLVIRYEEETRELPLTIARVVELEDPKGSREDRRARWNARREEYHKLHEKWEAAVAESPELQEVQQQFRELGGDFREKIQALRAADEGSPEQLKLRGEMTEMREEFTLLSEYAQLQLRDNPEFSEDDLENMGRATRMMAFRGDHNRGGDHNRRGGEGRGRPRGENRERGGERNRSDNAR